nr:mar14 transposase [synthetic construct]
MQEYGVYAGDVDVVFEQEELDDSDEEDEHQNKNLTKIQRQQIYAALAGKTNNGILRKNATTEVAAMFNVKRARVQAIWRRVKQCRAQGIPIDVRSRKKKNCGRKKKEINLTDVANVPLQQRGTLRSFASASGIPKSTLHKMLKEGLLRRHSNTLKPLLKEENNQSRLRWCLSMLDWHTLPNQPKFIDMRNIVHIDEKWFNTTKRTRTIYMVHWEDDPYRPVQNKNSIDKVMFLAAITRPRYNEEGICTFDGKIGLWPFTRKEPAQRTSHNRPRGTLVTKTIKVDRNTVRSFLIAKVLRAIIASWPPEEAHNTIWIQQDNAPSHVPVDDPQFAYAVSQTGFDIRLMHQPPNSPDMNALDLGFFASLQSLTYRRISRNMDDLIDNVEQEFQAYDDNKLNRVFLTLQSCLLEVMKADGGNGYKIPHMGKERLERLDILPNTLSCDFELYDKVTTALANQVQ